MNQRISNYNHNKLDKAMSQEQFTEIVDAILDGKYSWACVLILRSAGYNPLHYIPYRTYNRLIKENCQVGKQDANKTDSINTDQQTSNFKSNMASSGKTLNKISDLAYIEVANETKSKVRGGGCYLGTWLSHIKAGVMRIDL